MNIYGKKCYFSKTAIMLDKDFKKDFNLLLSYIENKENFAFVRFSDGEADILNNIKLVITSDYVIEGNTKHNFGYNEEDHKCFDPDKHGFVRDKLIESFLFSKIKYFAGIACPCCIGGVTMHNDMKLNIRRTNEYLTWANLLVNSNYPDFVERFIPALKKRKIVMVCSENANIDMLNFDIIKDFRVGKNCIVNDHHLIDTIKEWIKENDITNCVFLFSASSLSEILIYELYKEFDNNTYLDIGTTLHLLMDLKCKRDYLQGYWEKKPSIDLKKCCQWSYDCRLIRNEEPFWESIRQLRNNEKIKKGFIKQKTIDEETHFNFMKKYGANYYVCLIDNSFAGFVGQIDGDIRVATHPDFQGRGIAKFMINELIKKHPNSFAKIKINNQASLKLFEKCGFEKKYYVLEK